MITITHEHRKLFLYAVSCALRTFVDFASARGRGWYHYSDGEIIVASEIVLPS